MTIRFNVKSLDCLDVRDIKHIRYCFNSCDIKNVKDLIDLTYDESDSCTKCKDIFDKLIGNNPNIKRIL